MNNEVKSMLDAEGTEMVKCSIRLPQVVVKFCKDRDIMLTHLISYALNKYLSTSNDGAEIRKICGCEEQLKLWVQQEIEKNIGSQIDMIKSIEDPYEKFIAANNFKGKLYYMGKDVIEAAKTATKSYELNDILMECLSDSLKALGYNTGVTRNNKLELLKSMVPSLPELVANTLLECSKEIKVELED